MAEILKSHQYLKTGLASWQIKARLEKGEIPANISVGILGGGQLARMLAEAAFKLGFHPVVFTESEMTPAARLGAKSIFGRGDEVEPVREFLSLVRWCVFESEFVSSEILEKASSGLDVIFHPSLQTMARFQDKIQQKNCCEALNIPTPSFHVFPKDDNLDDWIAKMLVEFADSCVFKWGRLGYDGKGVFFASQDSATSLLRFGQEAIDQGISLYAEKKINFKRELALMSCYSAKGEFKAYPLVVSEQTEGICHRVYGPATSLGVTAKQEQLAQGYARQIAENFSLFGCFGIEFFEMEEGQLLVNEIAPRVHNSGHFTQDASETSQFENHWRAVFGIPLGETRSLAGFAMQNLLGPPHVSMNRKEAVLPIPTSQLHLHWYDKEEILPRRKLGHLNGTVDSYSKLPELLQELEKCYLQWSTKLTQLQKENEKK